MENELWKPKRLVWEMRTPISKTEASSDNEEAEKTPLGINRIQQFLGKSNEEAKDEVQKLIDANHDQIQHLIDNWRMAGVAEHLWTVLSVGNMLGFSDPLRKQVLNESLTQVAQGEAQKVAERIFEDQADKETYARNALNIMGHKVDACNHLIGSLGEDLKGLQERQKIVNKAMSGLRAIRKVGAWANPLSSNIQGKINRLKEIQANVESIKRDSEARLQLKEKKTEQIRGWDQSLRALINPSLDTPEKSAEFERLFHEAMIKGSVEMSTLKDFVNKLSFGTSTEKSSVKTLLSYLEGGTWTAKLPTETARDWATAVTTDDIRNYYLNKAKQFSEANQEGDAKKSLQLLKQNGVGQEVQIGDKTYIVIKSEEEGVLVRDKEKSAAVGYLNLAEEGKLIFTLHGVVSSKKKFAFVQYELKGAESSKSLNTVDFAIDKQVKVQKGESYSNEDEKKEKTRSIKERLKEVFEKARGLISST